MSQSLRLPCDEAAIAHGSAAAPCSAAESAAF